MNTATVPPADRGFGGKRMLRKRIELLMDPDVYGIVIETASKDKDGRCFYKEYESIMIDDDVDRVILEDEIKVHRRAKE